MNVPAGPGRALREIGGPQDTGIAIDVRNDLALIPDVIARRQDVDATIVELAAKAFGQAETARRVLCVYHHKVDVELPPQVGHMFLTASRPDRPMTSPQNRIFTDERSRRLGAAGSTAAGWSRFGRRRATPPWPA